MSVVAVGAALLAMSGSPAVRAAGPRHAMTVPRPDRAAWDRSRGDDPDRLIVTFRAGTAAATRRSSIARVGGTPINGRAAGRIQALKAPTGRSTQTIAAMRADPSVVRIDVDHRRFRDADPTSETYWHELWGLDNTGQDIYQGLPHSGGTVDADIDAPEAFAVTTGTPSTVVAVIDQGVDFSHPDLAARAWTNPGESGGGKETNGIDDDANGYVDDVHGWDFCHDDNTVHDFDDDAHGTHVAGTIAASLDGAGVVGVAPGISIMALKFLGDDPACGFDSQAIAAIAYAKSFGVHIANASWGGTGRPQDAPELRDAIAGSGLLLIAAAGNDGTDNDAGPEVELPATFDLPNIVSVAALDNNGNLAWFSDYGATSVDIAAPGLAVLSSLPADSTHPEPGWGWLDGTSMAAPHVTGSAALVASVLPSLASDPLALKTRLLETGKPMPNTAGETVTGTVVDPYRALDDVGPHPATPSTFGYAFGSMLGRTAAVARIGWPAASDDRSGVGAYALQEQAHGGSWTTAVAGTGGRIAIPTLSFGTPYAFRDRARDRARNWGPWSAASVAITPVRYEETSARVTYRGTWHVLRTASASSGRTRYSTHRGASVTFRFTGRAFAVVAPKSSTRGSARLYVDGRYVSTVNLHRSSWVPRIVVATDSWSRVAAHRVTLVVTGTAGHPRFDIDAFLTLR